MGGGSWSPASSGVQMCSLCKGTWQEKPPLFHLSLELLSPLLQGVFFACDSREEPRNDKQAVTAFRVSQIFHLWVSKHYANISCWASCARSCFPF